MTGVLRFGWYALLLASPVLVLIPFQGESNLKTAGWLSGYLAVVAVQLYGLIKAAMLWLVPGVLLALWRPRQAIQSWAVFAAIGCLLAGWVTLPAMGWDEVKEILFALPGLAMGLWTGARLRQSSYLAAEATAGQTVPDKMEAPAHHAIPRSSEAASHTPDTSAQPEPIRWGGRATGLLLGLAALAGLIDFPEGRFVLALGLIAYMAILLWRPWAWLFVVPAALPLLDLAPWTGRFFWDEFDMLMLATLAAAGWQGRIRLSAFKVSKLGGLLAGFVLVWMVSLLVGLFPLQSMDANAFSTYWSHYNSLRVAKGLLWGLVFYGLYRSLPENSGAFTKLSIGMALGVLGVSLWAIREQILFAGAATTADYRVTAGFSSMHTGGGHIEAYLVIALPFVWGLFFMLRHPLYRVLAGAVFLLGAYALFFTVSRGGVIGLGGALVVLVLGTWWARRKQSGYRAGLATPVVLGALTLALMAAGVSGVFWKQRLGQTLDDAGIRFHHWAEVLSLKDSGGVSALFGQGLGSLPEANLLSQLPDKAGSYRYAKASDNTYLTLNSAGTLYMAQRVAPHPEESLRLEVSVRAPSTQAGLEASLCEKILFNSLRCQWLKVDVKTGSQDWQSYTQTFNSGEVGSGSFLTRRPVQFSLYNPSPGTVVEVDNIRLLDARGQNLLSNGDFARGGDFWFFKSGDHLFWHAKNLWVHLLFEQGWLGVLLFTLILILALVRLARKLVGGEIEATVLLASMGAWVIVGGVDSLVDAPRIALLVYGTLFVGAAWGVVPRMPTRKTRRRRHPPPPRSEGEAVAPALHF